MVSYRILVRNPDVFSSGAEIPADIPWDIGDYLNGYFVGEFTVFKDLKFSKRLNNYGMCEFKVPVSSDELASLIFLRKYSVWIYRKDENGQTLVWSGEQALLEGDLKEDENNWATIYCYDWLEQLNSRYTAAEVSYTNVDAGEIAMRLIETTQDQTNGSLSITEGSIEATQDRDRTFYNQNIMEAIINLANVLNGFDFEITNDREFNVYSVMGTDKSEDIVLEYGYNIKNLSIKEDFTTIVNRAIVLGEGIGEDNLSRIERNNTTQQAINKVREKVITEMDVSELDTFEEKGDAALRKYDEPLMQIDMEIVGTASTDTLAPVISEIGLGDVITLKVIYGIFNINSTYRVFEWEVKFGQGGEDVEKLSLVLGNFTI